MNEISAKVISDGLEFNFIGCADDPITKHHLKFGKFYEEEPLKRLSRYISRVALHAGNYIVDAGANIGNHSLFFGGTFPDIDVYAFEMNPITYSFLSRNIKLSGLANVFASNNGLSSKPGCCWVKQNPSNPLGGAQLTFSGSGPADVSLITLDDWARTKDYGRCILLKLDVEGHEFEVLKGGEKFVINNMPMIYAELKDVPLFREVSNFLIRMGYVIAYAEDGDLPNFLFVRKADLYLLFSDDELEKIKFDLCHRVVDAWQLHRIIRKLKTSNK